MPIKILGVKIDNLKRDEAAKKVGELLKSGTQQLIFTPNPEMLVKAGKDPYFKDTLNSGNLNICDGMGLWLAGKLKGEKIDRIAGVDFIFEVCKIAEQEKCSVYLLGGREEGTAEKAAVVLKKSFPNLRIVGCQKGPIIKENFQFPISHFMASPDELVRRVSSAKPDILFVAFGMGKQEKWLRENLPKLPSVKIGMGVGGSFDYISGEVSRAPLLMRKVGLEWAYRLWKEPSRILRIYSATVVFGWLLLKSKILK